MAQPKTAKKRIWPWIALVVGLAVIGGVGLWAVLSFLGPATVAVPDVVGSPASAARVVLTAQGLKMTVTESFDETVAKGTIISQTPNAGTKVDKGMTVRVVVSKGGQQIEVPNLVGMTRDDAIAALKEAGLVVGKIMRRYSAKHDDDVVFDQRPKAKEKLPEGEAVDLFVSRGTQTVTVPNVIGEMAGAARRILGNAGLRARVAEQSSSEPAGLVLDQNPAAKNTVAINSIVTITVSKGPGPVRMPDVRRKTEAQAIDILEGLGLQVNVAYVPDKAKVVVRQSPSPGTRIEKGSTVLIYVGNGM